MSCSDQNKNEMGIFDKLLGKQKVAKTIKSIPSSESEQDSKELMDEDRFWKLIETAKSSSQGNYDKQQVDLNNELNQIDAIDILKFDNRFRTYRGNAYKWELWGAAYIMNGGCSDDCFSDFRGWLISRGKDAYFNAMSNPETLVTLNHDMENDDWEGFSYVPMTAYEQKTGSQMPKGIKENFEITGEEWEEDGDDLENKYPNLWQKWDSNN
ncbi:MAG: hypothetical protein ACJA1A_003208 [Saprospiraceae bacterium]|jgi:hypothetical protein|tara:strand:+ start:2105 stop:2737 length:633 start_codon:yes stop_codon:yes gene_type:complete